MDVIVERCCGLDVHQGRIVACVMSGAAGAKPKVEVRTFRTFTRDLLLLVQWVKDEGCTQVAMESTGIYWKPIYALLEAETEGGITLLVGNAKHMKSVPGRKTDVKDAQWIAHLARHGLIRPSFIPSQQQRQLRDFTRYRKSLVEDRTSQCNRILKLLETANVKLASVASSVFGVSGTAMLEALVKNQLTVDQMAELARGRLRAKLDELKLALEGRLTTHHRKLLELQLKALRQHDKQIAQVDRLIAKEMKRYEQAAQLLVSTPGISETAAASIVAETGIDMTVFASQRAFGAWTGLAPGNNESAGKHRPAPIGHGNKHLRLILIQCAWAAVRTKDSFWRDKFYRLKARRGGNRAIVAIAHKLAKVIYAILKTGEPYKELGANFLDQVDRERSATNYLKRLERLGFDVTMTPKVA